MKKLLEVLQYGEDDIRFNTDVNVMKNPEQIPEITSLAAFAMMTTLHGGKEDSVMAIIRALTIADIAACEHPEALFDFLKERSEMLKESWAETFKEMEIDGARIITSGPSSNRQVN